MIVNMNCIFCTPIADTNKNSKIHIMNEIEHFASITSNEKSKNENQITNKKKEIELIEYIHRS